MVALVACSVWSREPVLPLLLAKLGGLGLGGGVDFPKECFLGDEPVEPKKKVKEFHENHNWKILVKFLLVLCNTSVTLTDIASFCWLKWKKKY